MNLRAPYLAACISLISLIFLGIAWELRLAPLQPGGSTLVFKILPLLLPLFGILHGKRYTYKWASLLILLYFAEGMVRATSDRGMSQSLAIVEACLSTIFFVAAIIYVRKTRPQKQTAEIAPGS
ncbi:MAG: DUF2069 domain-containing protein [Betaproteobacteria bacterium]|jgi:uncharacterized membrane protein|uniref:DUF2069 domain-containing protein n=1 Tax=Candidatus Proximibacter danicus TaxID=2954365 RepID=A0A9D7K3B1_9PROT|nr:DUF2069 domain-containing protein [Candidatus Proximibacter danicus]